MYDNQQQTYMHILSSTCTLMIYILCMVHVLSNEMCTIKVIVVTQSCNEYKVNNVLLSSIFLYLLTSKAPYSRVLKIEGQ